MITVLAGGVGAAKLLRGLVEVVPSEDITVVVNTADDFVLHGLHISPDIDTIRYTLTNDVGEHGWGRSDESWRAMGELGELARSAPRGSRASDWFKLGDRDIAVHLYRTQRLREGASLCEVTTELSRSSGLDLRMIPMSNNAVSTMFTLTTGETIDFQEYFVARQHRVAVASLELTGIENAEPAPGVLDAIQHASSVIIAPSNPIVSVGPVLAVPGIGEAVQSVRDRVIAVSPIVDGRAIKGPADRLLRELGHEASAVGVARVWTQYASTLVVDESDRALVGEVEATAMQCVVAPTIMSDTSSAAQLARVILANA